MLTACWQQVAFIPGQHCNEEVTTVMMLNGLEIWNAVLPLLTPWWQQRIDSVRRVLKKTGVL
jgi:hypothetical protein